MVAVIYVCRLLFACATLKPVAIVVEFVNRKTGRLNELSAVARELTTLRQQTMKQHASLLRKAVLTLALGLLPSGSTALAGSATWANLPTNLNWNLAGNWVPATVPNGPADTATIGASFAHSISIGANTEVDGIVFTPDATGQYAITTNPANTLTLSGVGIINDSATTHNFVTSATLSFQGLTRFTNSASAGILTNFITAGGDTSGGSGGITQFNDASTAGFATFLNGGGTANDASGGMTQFRNTATASHGDITNNAGVEFSDGGSTEFHDDSTADSATIINKGSNVTSYSGGVTRFLDSSTAAQAVITNEGSGTTEFSAGGFTSFSGTATAGHAQFFNLSSAGYGGNPGIVEFSEHSSAGDGTFTNRNGANPGLTTFLDNSTAGSARFTLEGGAAAGLNGGWLQFLDESTAGDARITVSGGVVEDFHSGCYLFFGNRSTGGTARVEVFGNGLVDISRHDDPGLTIGSIEGSGYVGLGARQLTVGSNDQSTEFSGAIQNGGSGGVGGSLTKIGAGKLTLSGTNTYTGGTTVSGGTLAVNGSILGAVAVNDGATLAGSGTIGGLVTVETGGTLSPGDSPGVLTVGALTLDSGSLSKFELAGTMPAEYDRVNVSLLASLSGTLQVLLDPAFTPAAGNSFDILDWGSISGTFGSIQLPALVGGMTWNASQLYVTGTLSVGGVLGDYNQNGIVDVADYTVWRDALGQSGIGLAADGDGDQMITEADYGIWKTNFGHHAGGGAGVNANAAVPEPATMVLIAGILAICSRRRALRSIGDSHLFRRVTAEVKRH